MLGFGVDTEVKTPPLPGLNIRLRMGRRDTIRKYVVLPGVNPMRKIVVHNNSLQNLSRAAAERVLYRKGKDGVYRKTPRPLDGVFNARLGAFRSALLKSLPSTTPVALEEFPGMYKGRKQVIYTQAVESLLLDPVTEADAEIRIFVKSEKVDQTEKGDSAPRMISPRSTRYNAAVGRFLKPAEKKLFRGIANVWGSPAVVAKGFNMLEVGNMIRDKWRRFDDPVAVGVDAARFDQHCSEAALKWEHSCWNGWFRNKELATLLKMQLTNRCVGYCDQGKVEYTVKGCRMSGDMNTSSGNCLIMCGLMHAYSAQKGVVTDLVNNGDDCVLFLERRDLSHFMEGFRAWFLQMGYDMVVEEPVFELEKVEFCQAHPVYIGQGDYLMVRNIHSTLAKDSVAIVPVNNKDCVTSWVRAVGECGEFTYGSTPVLGEFYRMFRRSGKRNEKLSKNYDWWWYHHISRDLDFSSSPVLPETRLSFYIAFGITPDEQLAIEQMYREGKLNTSFPQNPHGITPDAAQEITEIVRAARAAAPSC